MAAETITFTVVGPAFFPLSTGGSVTVTVRKDRSGNLILRKCIVRLAEESEVKCSCRSIATTAPE
jgi:hypothetical protein